MRKSMIGTCLLAFVLVGALPTMAQEGRMGRGPGHPPGHPPVERMLERLDLSESQRADIEGMLEQSREAVKDKVMQLRERQSEMEQLLKADEIDESSYRAAALEAAELEADLALNRARTTRQMKAQLTPEQQAEMEKMADRRQGMNRRPPTGRGGPREGQHPHREKRDLE